MKKFLALTVTPLFAGFLWAQTDQPAAQSEAQRSDTTTTSTTWNGTLVDAGCRTTHTERTDTNSSTKPDENTTKTQTTHTTSDVTECPVTETTTSFGLLTPEGQYMTFDQPSNEKIVGVVKTKKWNKDMEGHRPVKVRVIGTPNGNTIVMESIK